MAYLKSTPPGVHDRLIEAAGFTDLEVEDVTGTICDGIPQVANVPMTAYERLVNPADLPDEVSRDVHASIKAVRARARLLAVLNNAHTEAPGVPAEEVEEDVLQAIREVRAGRAK